MTDRNTQIRAVLAAGPVSSASLRTNLGVTRPTLARALAEMSAEIVTLGAARATQYALRDSFRGLADMPVYRVNATGQIKHLGQLCPVRPDGFVVLRIDGKTDYHEGLPWWLADMRPQGFLGRAYARQHASGLGLPPDVRHWSDTDALRALLASGGDAVGNLLLGDVARERFVNALAPVAVVPTLTRALLPRPSPRGTLGLQRVASSPSFALIRAGAMCWSNLRWQMTTLLQRARATCFWQSTWL